jgi:hypothetical protein
MKEQLISSKPEEVPRQTMYEITARVLTLITGLSFIVVWFTSWLIEGDLFMFYFQGMGIIEPITQYRQESFESTYYLLDHSMRFMCICGIYPLYYFRKDFFKIETLFNLAKIFCPHIVTIPIMICAAYWNIIGPFFFAVLLMNGLGVLYLICVCMIEACKDMNKEGMMIMGAVASIVSFALFMATL